MAPDNGIIGDSYGTDLPQADLPEQDLSEEKRKARFSKTAEFKKLKEQIESRIEFYQTYLPDGRPVATIDPKELGSMWVASNIIIAEFRAIIDEYERASEVIRNELSSPR
jgi:hypothetical protein